MLIQRIKSKPWISITGRLLNELRIGKPALYLYNGELIRTTAVRFILDSDPDHACFETQNSIYQISCDTPPQENGLTAA